MGSNADYMFRTLAAVHAAGGSDFYLEQLAALVGLLRGRQSEATAVTASAPRSGRSRPRPSNRHIAERLVLSERTIEGHVRNILAKTGLGSRAELIRRILRDL